MVCLKFSKPDVDELDAARVGRTVDFAVGLSDLGGVCMPTSQVS